MEETYEKLRRQGRNSVDLLVKWLKDSNIISNAKEAENNARKLFDEVEDKSNVELEEFKQAIDKIATQQRRTSEDLTKTLGDEGQKLMGAVETASASFFESLKQK